MVMDNLTDYGDREEEELRRVREQAAANIQPPPLGYGMAGSVASTLPAAPGYQPPPDYGPPQPTYAENVQAMYAKNPELVSVAAGEAQANNVDGNLAQLRSTIAQQQAQETDRANRDSGLTQVNPTQAGFRDGYVNPPNVTPGGEYAPNPDYGIATPFHVINQAAQPYVVPAANFLAEQGRMAFERQADIQSMGSGAYGGAWDREKAGAAGDFVGRAIIPQSVEEAIVNSLGGGGVTGWDDVLRGAGGVARAGTAARGYADNVVRGAFPEQNLAGANYGSFPVPPMNPRGGENVYGFGARGASADDAATFAAQREAALNNPYPWGPATPETPPLPSEAYPSFPQGTMGEMFPDVRNMADARGGAVREIPIDPSSPAARMGAPLAYDPQYIPGTREYVAREAFETGANPAPLTGGGSTPNPPLESVAGPVAATPPPASLTPDASPPASGSYTTSPPGTTIAALGDGGAPPSAIPQAPPNLAQAEQELYDAIRRYSEANRGGAGGLNVADATRGGAGGGRSGGMGGDAIGGSGRAGSGGAGAKGNPLGRAYNAVVDLLYAPFGFDQSQWFRQLDVRTLNPLRAAETAQSFRASAEAMGSADTARRIFDAQQVRVDNLGVKMNLGEWGGDFINREAMTSNALNKVLPGYEALNRGFITAVNERRVIALEDFVKNHPKAKMPEVQTYANYLERVTGRGAFGGADDALSKLGPLFTSLRFTASWPQRAANLMPYHRLADGSWQIGGSAWGEAVKDHAGFIATGLTTMYLAQQAGLDVGWDPRKSDFGHITVGQQHVDIWGGGKQYVKAVFDVVNGEKNGKPYPKWLAVPKDSVLSGVLPTTSDGTYRGTVAEFLRNKSGPVPGAIAAGLKQTGAAKALGIENEVNFLRPDYWDKGVTGKDLGWADRVAQYVVPLWVQDVAKAVMADGKVSSDDWKSAAIAGAAGFTGMSTQTWSQFPLTALRNEVQNDPRLPEAIRGIPYKDQLPDGKAAIDALVQQDKPDEYQEAIQQRNENSDPVWAKHRETTAQINKEEAERKTEIYNALRNGTLTGEQVRQGRTVVESAANARREEARNDKDYKKAIAGLEKNDAYEALDTYFRIQNTLKTADGKPDWIAIREKQGEFLQFLNSKDPKVANQVAYEANTTKAASNELDKLYEMAAPLLQKYFGDIKDDYARATAQKNNPRDDAFLALLGYGKTQSPEAARILQQMRSTLPPASAPVAAGTQRSVVAAPPAAPPPMQPASPIGPDGRTIAQITGTPYRSDAERAWYFESRGLPIPTPGAPAARPQSAPASVPRTGNVPPPTGARLPPVAPGEFNSPTASPQQRENFINAMIAPANAYAYTGIPPAVWAAMGASESNWGRAPSVFGIKGVGSAGGANLQTHEILGGRRVDMPDQFAAYNNLDDAFRHFIDLTSSGRYAGAHRILEAGDWQGFLQGIVQAGYATDKTWANSIINLASHIEKTYPQINRR